MKIRPRILIVTPTLGDSPFLDATVESVLSQRLDILHVLSVPAARVAAMSERYPHARVVADAGRAGAIYGALNAALQAVPDGWDWFTYINDDDALLPGFGRAALAHLDHVDAAPVLYGDVELIDERGDCINKITTTPVPSWIPALLGQGISPLMQQGMLFRRDVVRLLGGFDLRYRLCADLDFWLRAYAAGNRFHHVGRAVAQFRLREGQLSGDTRLTIAEQDGIVARHLPAPIPLAERWAVRLAYRIWNAPRYLARIRSRGLRTSYSMLQPSPVRT